MNRVQTPQSFCQVGVSSGDITPPVGMYHRMWGAATHDRSTDVHRPIGAAVIAFKPISGDNVPSVLLVTLDHCILEQAVIDDIRNSVAAVTSFAPGDVHIALSHTHASGLLSRDRAHLPGGDLIAPYLVRMTERIAHLAKEAEQRLQPAWIVYGTGRCDLAAHRDYLDEATGKYVCGFNPDRPADDTVIVARITSAQGKIIATMLNYACHPTTLAWQNTLVSPDYVGAAREVVQAATGGAPCLFLQGASGELGPREGFVGDVHVADRNGRQLGYAALSAIESLPPPRTQFEYKGPVVSGAVLGTWEHVPLDEPAVAAAASWKYRSWTIPVPFRTDLPKVAQVKADREALVAKQADTSLDEIAARDLRAKIEQADRQIMRLEALPLGDSFPIPVALLQIGNGVWVWIAAEHYSVLQTSIRERFPELSIVIATNTDGWQPGYVVPADVFGKGIYQEIIGMIGPDSLNRVIDAIGAQIEQWNA